MASRPGYDTSLRRLPLEDRLWAQIEPEPNTGCWFWSGYVGSEGYGNTGFHGRVVRAHRVVYQVIGKKKIPNGMTLDHLCRVRSCVNPDHLEPASNRQNVLRGVGITAVNARKTHCIHGHELTPENLRPGPLARGSRVCRLCMIQREEGYRQTRRLREGREPVPAKPDWFWVVEVNRGDFWEILFSYDVRRDARRSARSVRKTLPGSYKLRVVKRAY